MDEFFNEVFNLLASPKTPSNPKDKASQILLDLGVPKQVFLGIQSLEPGARHDCAPGSKAHKLLGLDIPSRPVAAKRPSSDVSVRSKNSLTHRLRQFALNSQFSPKASDTPHEHTPPNEEAMREAFNWWSHPLNLNVIVTQTTFWACDNQLSLLDVLQGLTGERSTCI